MFTGLVQAVGVAQYAADRWRLVVTCEGFFADVKLGSRALTCIPLCQGLPLSFGCNDTMTATQLSLIVSVESGCRLAGWPRFFFKVGDPG